jgi:hypothetical protein
MLSLARIQWTRTNMQARSALSFEDHEHSAAPLTDAETRLGGCPLT